MTITNILPSLRLTLPDPMALDHWPEYPTATTTDVCVAGVSLLRLVDWSGTPCVHTAAAVVAGTRGRPSDIDLASVVVMRVESVAVPCAGTTALRDIRQHAAGPRGRLTADRERDQFPFVSCGR